MANKSCVGDPAAHRRMVGPLAARRFDALVDRFRSDEPWRPLVALGGEPDASVDEVVLAGALCAVDDIGAALTIVRRILVPGGRLRFVEHVRRPGVLGVAQRVGGRAYAAVPGGCHVGHDVTTALKHSGFVTDEVQRVALPSAVPLIRHWVAGVARSRS